MINNYKTQSQQFKANSYIAYDWLCNQDEYFEVLLALDKPKIISNLINPNLTFNKSSINLNNNFVDVKNNNIDLSNTSRFEKKHKNNVYSEDILDIKKKKNKLQKKSRKQIAFESDKAFRNNVDKVLLNEDNLNHDIIKVPKSSKNKKKQQNDNIQIDQNLPYANLDESVKKEVTINRPLTIQELSNKLGIPEAEIITYLFLKGIAVTINQIIDIDIAKDVTSHYGFTVKQNISNETLDLMQFNYHDSNSDDGFIERPPVITILGHVDHGKTTLLDTILNTNVVTKEYGGITQAITNYEVDFLYEKKLQKLIFLDTPGHQAFSSLRIRGTQVTDLVLLVVAADDGLKPQTIESIEYILEKKLSYIVVINKIDKIGINTEKVREKLAEYNIIDQSWGGDALITEVSALKNLNIDQLLSHICKVTTSQNLKANPNELAVGTVLETYLDIQRGPVVVIIVQNGSLHIGDFIVAGNVYGKVKVINTDQGIKLNKALPSSIVQVLGFSTLPKAGTSFYIVNDKKSAEYSIDKDKQKSSNVNNLNSRITWDSINQQTSFKNFNLILKTDSQGSLEAIINAFNNISQSKVQINLLHVSFGNISNTDIELASTTNASIIGFNVNISNQANYLAKQINIVVKTFNIIYDVIDDVTLSMLNLVEPEYDKFMIGKAKVQTVFSINKGSVAGCIVTEGKLAKKALLNIYRNLQIIHSTSLDSLKRVKEDVDEVSENNECGIMCYDYTSWAPGDIVEAYELKQKEKRL